MIKEIYTKNLNKMAFVNPLYNIILTSVLVILNVIVWAVFYKIFPSFLTFIICFTCFAFSTHKLNQLFHSGLRMLSFRTRAAREKRANEHKALVKQLTNTELDSEKLAIEYIYEFQKIGSVDNRDHETLITFFVFAVISLMVAKGWLTVVLVFWAFVSFAILMLISINSKKLEI